MGYGCVSVCIITIMYMCSGCANVSSEIAVSVLGLECWYSYMYKEKHLNKWTIYSNYTSLT